MDFGCFFRFNNSFQDLRDVMKTLEREFQENCTDLYNNWYGEIKNLLSKKKATDGVVLKRIPEFLKCIMYTISLTVRCNKTSTLIIISLVYKYLHTTNIEIFNIYILLLNICRTLTEKMFILNYQ